MEVQKGIVSQMMGACATVTPSQHPDIVTQPLVVPFYWREQMGNLQAGDEVYFIEDDAHGGFIIGRTNGEWDFTLRGSLVVTEKVTAENITAKADATAAGVSLKSHTHTSAAPGAPTSPPNAA